MFTTIKKLYGVLSTHAGVKIYGGNMGWLFVERVAAIIFGFVVGVYVAWSLGADLFGILSYSISLATIFSVIMVYGMDQIIIRELVKCPDKRDEYLGSGFAIRLAGFAVMMLCLTAYLGIVRPTDGAGLMVFIICIGFSFNAFSMIDLFFLSRAENKYSSLSRLFALVVFNILRLVLVLCGAELVWFAAVEMSHGVCSAAGYIYFYRRRGFSLLRWRFSKVVARYLLLESWPFWLGHGALLFYMRIDQVMIRHYLTDADVGIYSVAVRLAEMFFFVPVVIFTALLPALLRSYERSQSEFWRRMECFFSAMFFLAIPAVALLWLGSLLVVPLYGAEYAGAAPILRLYGFTLILHFTAQPLNVWFVSGGRQRYALVYTLLIAGANVALNAVLIPRFGVVGAAWATIIAYTAPILYGVISSKWRRITLLRLVSPFRIFSLLKQISSL